MGQRLVVTVVKDQKRIAAIYYHWSAYSLSALEETRDVLDCLLDDESKIKDLRLRLIRFCEKRGGCIDGAPSSLEYASIQEMYPSADFKSEGSRNEGLIALTEEGMDRLESWSEGDITINLDDGIIYNSVFFEDTIDEYMENFDSDEEGEANLYELQNVELQDVEAITKIEFDKLDDAIEIISDLQDNRHSEFRCGDIVYSLIW